MKKSGFLRKLIFSLAAVLSLSAASGFSAESFYWEKPVRIQNKESQFPKIASNREKSILFWQEIDSENEYIYLSCGKPDEKGRMEINQRFAGPFEYFGEIPDIYSVAMNSQGTIALTVLASENLVYVYTSRNQGKSFTQIKLPEQKAQLIAPRIYALKNGGFSIFASMAKPSSSSGLHEFNLYSSFSADSENWSGFSMVEALSSLRNPFYPVAVSDGTGNYLVVQAQYQDELSTTYQLYSSYSLDGKNWQSPQLITGEKSLESTEIFSEYDNQRPFAFCYKDKVLISWERTRRSSGNSSLWLQQIGKSGTVEGSSELINDSGSSKSSVLFEYKGDLYASWYDNRSGGNSVYLGHFDGSDWESEKLSSSKNNTIFPQPVLNDSMLSFAWQEDSVSGKATSRIWLLTPDVSVQVPLVSAVNYRAGTHSKNKKVKFRVKMPEDVSGINSYVYSWSQDSSVQPDISSLDTIDAKSTTVSLSAEEEGTWYFKARIEDNAGNWSEAAAVEYYLDLTPPKAPSFTEQVTSVLFQPSNSFTVSWNPSSADSDIAGYTYELKYLGPVNQNYTESPGHKLKVPEEKLSEYGQSLLSLYEKQLASGVRLKEQIKTKIPQVSYKNLKNGVYVLSVAAIDEVGYTGQAVSIPVLLNKYVPRTRIYSIKTKETAFGELSFDIFGEDFNYNGTISKIYIDKDGRAPYDLIISRGEGGYKVSDSRISGINLGTDLDEGSYFVGIVHSDRGLLMTSTAALKVETNGTVKIDKEYEYVPAWKARSSDYLYRIHGGMIVLYAILGVSALAVILFGIALLKNLREYTAVKRVVQLLEKGELMAEKTENQIRRNGSLKKSLMQFTASLVIFIIILLSVMLGTTMLRIQERTLTEGLQQRVNVLLSSIVTGAGSALPSEDLLELSQLHNQMSSLDEAEFLTVTGIKSSSGIASSDAASLLHVWDSNDKNINSKIDRLNSRHTSFEPGISILTTDSQYEQDAAEICGELNKYLKQTYGGKIQEREGLQLERRNASRSRLEEINSQVQNIDSDLTVSFEKESAQNAASIPAFDTQRLNSSVTDYLFYQPVIYRSNSDSNLVHGIVFLKVSTTSLVHAVAQSRNRIITIVLSISVVLIAMGCIMAFIFAGAIVRPIRKLEKVVKDIAEEHDKERLLGNQITELPNNEIGRLGDSVNRMQKDLGWNAQELNLQLNASEIQQALVPLEPLAGNVKQNVSRIKDDKFDQFAYYKGAAGVSGDYFDCRKLDDRWYVLIKCDASGHAAPAGILVTIVATLYKKYFETWSYAKNGTKLDEFVYKVNDFLEGLNIKGKFVALFICLYDSKTGDVHMCHAGDKLLRIYDSQNRVLNKIELPETPAVGPIPSFMVEMKGGYSVEKRHLNPKDILLLYTDGIEENGRAMRNPDFSAVMKPKLNEKGEQLSDEYGNLLFEVEKEEFGEARVKEIVEAVIEKKKYVLTKESDPSAGEDLVFDLSSCTGTTEDIILALTSMEKVFRFYKPADVTEKDLVEVDVAIDGFLKKHFSLYGEYCKVSDIKPKNPNFVYYEALKEDVQEDDLTMIAVNRP